MIELLGVDGKLRGTSPMSLDQVVDALRLMLLSRAVDDRLIKLQRMGRVGVYGPVHGQEAAVIGSAMALDPQRDWIVPASREHPAMLRHGLPLKNMFATYMGNFDAAAVPDGVRLLPRQQSIGAQLPHAVGLAWALKLRRAGGVVAVYFGEGASSEGDFHEASNLAGVMRVPLVMLLINNHYAISTPVQRQTAAAELAARAEGYGFPGFVVDGNDLLAVYSATVDAVNRALAGGGPTLIECRTYRMGFHNTSDNPKEYRDRAEVDEAEQRDPIERVRRFAIREGIWSADQEAVALKEIRSAIETAQRQVEELSRPGAAAIFEHVYETLPPRLQQQMGEALDDARPH
ncbi:MAG TPA: thiamine pyrophosphate-dependent enzyme [Candidatus Micrarchaeaceae archaeon]|nr:thiamine pyrophosphate-dependent enzyme [Candidatus Micrarchaeaceae archaeon]